MLIYLMALLYIVAGITHFIKPDLYLSIVPPYLGYPKLLVVISGVFEIVFGLLLLIPSLRTWAAWGIILLLIAIFPANVYMAYSSKFYFLSPWIRWGRLPLQFVLIWWAYQYAN